VNSNVKTSIFWVVVAYLSVLLWQVVKSNKTRPAKAISFSELVNDVKDGKIRKISITDGSDVNGTYKDGSSLHTLIPDRYTEIYAILQDHGVEIDIKERNQGWVALLFNATPFILLIGFWIFMMRQVRGGNKDGRCGFCGRSAPPSAV
jgi:cell division protease FtsH